MSINYGYFRHRLDATNDPKIQKIIDLLGVEGLGFWWSLVELYGTAYNNSNREDLTVKIHKRVVANMWRKRVDSCDKVITKLQLSGNLVVTSYDSTYELTIPNFLKYFGSYQKKKEERTLKKRKEKKRKESNKIIKKVEPKKEFSADFVALFNDEEIITWLKDTGNKKIHDALLSEYTETFLVKEITNAFYWQQENKKRKAGTFLKGWCDRSNDPNKIDREKKLKEFDEEFIRKLESGVFDVCEQD